MGSVVKLEPTDEAKVAAKKRRARKQAEAARGVGHAPSIDRRRRPRRHKTALVLGGGGFTGGVYEIGALRALDLLAVNSSVNQFDVYVGTSAGAFIAALCANGVTPEEMMRVVTRQGKPPFKDVDLNDLLRPNLLEFARKGAVLPFRALSLAREVVSQRGSVSLLDVLLGLAEGLPSGAYTGSGIEKYMHEVLSEPERTDDFRELACELYLTATDLDTCERVVFGVEGTDEVPISTAVRASGALPMVYAPVRVGERELIDGGMVSTTNLDIAVEAGAKLVIVINPIVPFVNDFADSVRTLRGTRPRRVSDMGFPQIGYQAFKLVAHQRLHELAKTWEKRYPGVDIVLIEPEPTDELMFQTSMMNFTSRVEIARHGFESVTKHLAGEYDRYEEIAEGHGIDISGKRLRRVVEHFDAEPEQVSAWRKILEGTTSTLLRQSGSAG
ncbi:MAG TPA: patatin-like phospholipase family protein [Solirubrobacteraceae bacterium]|nr:patatin-like phospholipase family protein [Solirubrobacteraceae bacterium]